MNGHPRTGLYRGVVKHARMHPNKNAFNYKAYFICSELNEFARLAKSSLIFSHNRFNVMSFHDSDHGPRDGSPLRPWIEGVLAKVNIKLDGGEIKLLAFPRVLGFRFYPVSFWYCFHQDGTLKAILAEVNNTFHQSHNYLLHAQNRPLVWGDELQSTKVFYVSPFIPMSPVEYHFVFPEPSERLEVRMDVFLSEQLILKASLNTGWSKLTTASIVGALLRYGPMSLRAKFLIYWQATHIRFKGNKILKKPKPPEDSISL